MKGFRDSNGYGWRYRTGFMAIHELEDGRELKLTFVEVGNPSTWDDPAESERRGHTYYLDDVEFEWKDLPEDVREEIDAGDLEDMATEQSNFDFGDAD